MAHADERIGKMPGIPQKKDYGHTFVMFYPPYTTAMIRDNSKVLYRPRGLVIPNDKEIRRVNTYFLNKEGGCDDSVTAF